MRNFKAIVLVLAPLFAFAGDSYPGTQPVKIQDPSTRANAAVLTSAPGSDTGQSGVAVRVVSQVGVNGNQSVGTNNATAPTSSTQIGGQDGSGKLQAVKVNSSSALNVDNSANNQPVIGSGANNTAVGNPVDVAARAVAYGAQPTQITAGNRAELISNLSGILYVAIGSPNPFVCNIDSVTATTLCAAAPGASLSLYVQSVILSNGATAQNLYLLSGDSGGCTNPVTQVGQIATAARGQMTVNFIPAIKWPANKTLCCATAGATAFSCTVTGYIDG